MTPLQRLSITLLGLCLTALAQAAPPQRIVSTTPSVTGILLAMNAPLIASAATTPSRLTDDKGFFTQWAKVADERGVEVLYRNLQFDIEAVVASNPDLLIASATGADSAAPYRSELQAQGVQVMVVNYSNQSWQEIAIELGERTGLQSQAQAAIQRFDAHAAKAAASIKHPAGMVNVVGYNIGGSYSVGNANSPHGRLLTELGFKVAQLPAQLADKVTRASDFQFLSRENLAAALTGETVFLLGGGDADVQAFLADPVLANLPAVKRRQVYALGPTSFRIDYYSGLRMIDTVAASVR